MAYSWDAPYSPLTQPVFPQFQQPVQRPAQQAPITPSGGVQWVNGEQEAQRWMIAPNSAVALWDSSAPTVYLKTADATGRPELKIFDLVERVSAPPAAQAAPPDYITRDEFKALADQVARLQAGKATKKKEDDNNG